MKRLRAVARPEGEAGAARACHGTRLVWRGQARSNWPAFTPATNAFHSSTVKRRTGPPRSLESRMSTADVSKPTSTHWGLEAPEKVLFRNRGADLAKSFILMSFQLFGLFRRRLGVAAECHGRALSWADSWSSGWSLTCIGTCNETWIQDHVEQG
jgi:hypothetical protein